MKKLTKEQLATRDADLDWLIAQKFYYARSRSVWDDFSPTTDWIEGGRLIEKYKITIQWFDPKVNESSSGEWMGGLTICNQQGIEYFCAAYANTPLLAAMTALAKSFIEIN